jgi:hypothetical protein
MTVEAMVVTEERRGCGYRKPAKDGVGIYLVGPKTGLPCERLPWPLDRCPCCGGGVKPSRGWQWIVPRTLIGLPVAPCAGPRPAIAPRDAEMLCRLCPLGLGMPAGRHGLLWIGERFYPSPDDFMQEARRMGLSRKIRAVPREFVLGETVVYLAHRATPLGEFDEETGSMKRGPAIFTTFRPTGIDLVVADAQAVPEKAQHLAEQYPGARILQVVPAAAEADAQAALPLNGRGRPICLGAGEREAEVEQGWDEAGSELEEMDAEAGAAVGDPRRCPRHPEVVTSSPDGLHDAPCNLCEAEQDE